MREIEVFSLLCISMAAVLIDLRTGYIPNGVIATGLLWGLTYQMFSKGPAGLLLFLGGGCLPLLLLGGLYYFRMIGAGDIKLLCVVGGYLGPSDCFSCIAAAILFGGVISLVIMIRHHNFYQQIIGFSDYVNQYSKDKKWISYLAGTSEDARFCFSVPIFMGLFYQMIIRGGMI